MRWMAAWLLLLGATAWCQLAVQGPQSVYEGQNVGAVDLIGNPHRDVEPLRSLITQQAGQPYSQQKVQTSIDALQATGQFEKVQVNVVPDPNGLRLDFLLEPAYYLGMVNFPGASKAFSYTRLLQVVDLPDEDPFDKARVAVADDALLKFLQRNGYFQATVQTDSAIDDSHQLVNVTFTVDLGKQARVAKVSVVGPDPSESSRLLGSIKSMRARLTGGF